MLSRRMCVDAVDVGIGPGYFARPLAVSVDGAHLEIQQRVQAGGDSGMRSAGVEVGDQPCDRFPNGSYAFQHERWGLRILAGQRTIAPADTPAEFGGSRRFQFVRIFCRATSAAACSILARS